MSAERDLAEAIHHEIISPERVDAALDRWNERADLPGDRDRMWFVLARTSAAAIDAVLARRQSEAARTGPWEGPLVKVCLACDQERDDICDRPDCPGPSTLTRRHPDPL